MTAKQGIALANGIVAILVFKVAEEPPEHQAFKLRNVARALGTDDPPSPIEPVTGSDGEIELFGSAPPVAACFSYMH